MQSSNLQEALTSGKRYRVEIAILSLTVVPLVYVPLGASLSLFSPSWLTSARRMFTQAMKVYLYQSNSTTKNPAQPIYRIFRVYAYIHYQISISSLSLHTRF